MYVCLERARLCIENSSGHFEQLQDIAILQNVAINSSDSCLVYFPWAPFESAILPQQLEIGSMFCIFFIRNYVPNRRPMYGRPAVTHLYIYCRLVLIDLLIKKSGTSFNTFLSETENNNVGNYTIFNLWRYWLKEPLKFSPVNDHKPHYNCYIVRVIACKKLPAYCPVWICKTVWERSKWNLLGRVYTTSLWKLSSYITEVFVVRRVRQIC
jgi:hypothetical protein